MDEINSSLKTNYAVRNFAGDVYSMFFKNSGDTNTFGSLIGNAPPIWHDIAGAFCADGSIKPMHLQEDKDIDPSNGLVFQSYMPDLYVYVDDQMTDNLGRPSNHRVHAGDWKDFSNIPGTESVDGNAYMRCDAKNRGSGGNPWNVKLPVPFIGDGLGNQPSLVFHCDDPIEEFGVNLTQ
ncbi:hypothetical protein ABT187_05505 [Streptomyces sp. NPDC001817]|uniref:hypothetical protein n=1 Tax=Streptomyces sp. NPDC001817 TaxID=3154398 RepID=UPI003319F9C8